MDLESITVNINEYDKRQHIGSGTFGNVFLFYNTKNHKKYAGKIVKLEFCQTEENKQKVLREITLLHNVKHGAIIKLKGFAYTLDNPPLPLILTEYYEKGSLQQQIINESNSIADPLWTPTTKYIILIGISHAMKYLHSLDIIHRDLKALNVLLDKKLHPYLCDFGGAREIQPQASMTTNVGSPEYMAPEFFQNDPHYTKSVDIYAFGILMYSVMTASLLYQGQTSIFVIMNEVVNNRRPTIPEFIPDYLKSLIQRCWSQNPSERPTFDEIYQNLINDFTLSPEEVDENEIHEYIQYLDDYNPNDDDSDEGIFNHFLMKFLFFFCFIELRLFCL